jgi:hypothetical protein
VRSPTHHKQKRRHKWKELKPDRCFLSRIVGQACDEFLRKRGLKSVLLAIGFLWAVDANAQRAFTLYAQYGGPPGPILTSGSGYYFNSVPSSVQHMFGVAPCIIQMTGTVTVKVPYGELLLVVKANWVTIWQGEVCGQHTIPVNVTFPQSWNLGGNIWVEWGSINSSQYALGDGGLWEYQLTFYGL